MSNTLNDDLNIVANSDLVIELLEEDLVIIQKLDDEPNDVGGMTAGDLKATFDQAGLTIQRYINETLVPAVLAADATEQSRAAAELARETAEGLRVSAERTRADAEASRLEAEQNRVQAEELRETAEQARVDVNSGIVAQATAQALSAAESAASAANSATDARAYNAGGLLADGSTRVNGSAWYADKAKAYAEGGTYTEYNSGGFPVNVTVIGADQYAFSAAESADAAGASQAAAKISEDNAKYWAEQAQGAVSGDFAAKDLSNVTNADFLAKANAAGVGGGSGGSGDMASSVYDPTGKQTDIFAFAQDAAGAAESNANAYTNQKIAALPTPDVSGQISVHNTSGTAHDDIRALAGGKMSTDFSNASAVLSAAKGGTGVTSLDALKTALGVGGGAQIASGSYTGTGQSGSSNPNSLTFGFAPKVVMLFYSEGNLVAQFGSQDDAPPAYCVGICDSLTTSYTASNGIHFWGGRVGSNTVTWTQYKKSSDGKTITWMNTGSSAAGAQYNYSGVTYYYLAIG